MWLFRRHLHHGGAWECHVYIAEGCHLYIALTFKTREMALMENSRPCRMARGVLFNRLCLFEVA
jgi:hypothetical protein